MADLIKEYTDIRGIKHAVEHFISPSEEEKDREQLLERLFLALGGPAGHVRI